MSALLDELKDVATKIAGYAEEDLQKLASLLFHDQKSNVGLTTNGTPVALATQTADEYLADLLTKDPDTYNFVAGCMIRDQTGLAQPDVSGCNPPCSGPGSTPNGHWACMGNTCVWIPAL
jgi:hypothetical protein